MSVLTTPSSCAAIVSIVSNVDVHQSVNEAYITANSTGQRIMHDIEVVEQILTDLNYTSEITPELRKGIDTLNDTLHTFHEERAPLMSNQERTEAFLIALGAVILLICLVGTLAVCYSLSSAVSR